MFKVCKSLFVHNYDVMIATNVSVILVSISSWRGLLTVHVQDALRWQIVCCLTF